MIYITKIQRNILRYELSLHFTLINDLLLTVTVFRFIVLILPKVSEILYTWGGGILHGPPNR
ncbi:hypothetical protein Hanom_Chr17g01548371 [Helianthus anomalus]